MTASFKNHQKASHGIPCLVVQVQPEENARVVEEVSMRSHRMATGWKSGSGRRARSNWDYFTWRNLTTGICLSICIIAFKGQHLVGALCFFSPWRWRIITSRHNNQSLLFYVEGNESQGKEMTIAHHCPWLGEDQEMGPENTEVERG